MTEAYNEDMAVVEALRPAQAGWLSWPKKPRAPEPRSETTLFREGVDLVGKRRWLEHGPADEVESSATLFYQVYRGQMRGIHLTFAGLKEKEGHKWDLSLEGTFQIASAEQFLVRHALSCVSVGDALTRRRLATMLGETVRNLLADGIGRDTIDQLRNHGLTFWTQRLVECCGKKELGISVLGIASAQWHSASAKAAEMEVQEQVAQQRAKDNQAAQLRVELQRSEIELTHAAGLEEIRLNTALDSREWEQRIKLLDRQHQGDLLSSEKQLEEIKQAAERSVTEHRLRMARLEREIAEEHHAARQAELHAQSRAEAQRQEEVQLEQQHRQRMESLRKGIKDLEAQRDLIGYQQQHESSARILEHSLRAKQEDDGKLVGVNLMQSHTRDVGAKRLDAIHIGDRLILDCLSNRAGYVTLLNIGTSGRTHVLVPNQFMPPERATIIAGRQYAVPGTELLSLDDLRRAGFHSGLFVEGMPGWEVMALIVSRQPLITSALLAAADVSKPFFTLRESQVDEVLGRLAELHPEEWSVGLVSFMTEERAAAEPRR